MEPRAAGIDSLPSKLSSLALHPASARCGRSSCACGPTPRRGSTARCWRRCPTPARWGGSVCGKGWGRLLCVEPCLDEVPVGRKGTACWVWSRARLLCSNREPMVWGNQGGDQACQPWVSPFHPPTALWCLQVVKEILRYRAPAPMVPQVRCLMARSACQALLPCQWAAPAALLSSPSPCNIFACPSSNLACPYPPPSRSPAAGLLRLPAERAVLHPQGHPRLPVHQRRQHAGAPCLGLGRVGWVGAPVWCVRHPLLSCVPATSPVPATHPSPHPGLPRAHQV